MNSVVWALNPIRLNALTLPEDDNPGSQFALTWLVPQNEPIYYLRLIWNSLNEGREGDAIYSDEYIEKWKKAIRRRNIGAENIMAAWEGDRRGTPLPAAVLPTNIHQRMSVQKSCFTVWGTDKRTLVSQLQDRDEEILQRYAISPLDKQKMLDDLRLLGISHSTIFPDLDGLAKELSMVY